MTNSRPYTPVRKTATCYSCGATAEPDPDMPLCLNCSRKDIGQLKADGHFWKRTEHTACNRGDKMVDMDMTRYQTGTWKRARDAQK